MNTYGRFYKPRSKREIFEFLRRRGIAIGKLRTAPFKQCYAVYTEIMKSALDKTTSYGILSYKGGA